MPLEARQRVRRGGAPHELRPLSVSVGVFGALVLLALVSAV